MHNARWSHGNCVLIGDALHTAHFSIGSGTRLAMEDAIALDKALAAHGDVAAALAAFESGAPSDPGKAGRRRQWQRRMVRAIRRHMRLAPVDFAMSYITRSGRVDLERLRRLSPKFVARYEKESPSRRAAARLTKHK